MNEVQILDVVTAATSRSWARTGPAPGHHGQLTGVGAPVVVRKQWFDSGAPNIVLDHSVLVGPTGNVVSGMPLNRLNRPCQSRELATGPSEPSVPYA